MPGRPARPGDPAIRAIETSGFVDTHLEAHNAEAFETVFGGSSNDIATRVAAIEDCDTVADVVAVGYERNRALADKIAVRIDDVRIASPDEAEVTFTVLLDGNAVLDNLPGSAVRADGRWLVTKSTFCSVGTLGSTDLPAGCR